MADFLQRNIQTPLGMSDTGVDIPFLLSCPSVPRATIPSQTDLPAFAAGISITALIHKGPLYFIRERFC